MWLRRSGDQPPPRGHPGPLPEAHHVTQGISEPVSKLGLEEMLPAHRTLEIPRVWGALGRAGKRPMNVYSQLLPCPGLIPDPRLLLPGSHTGPAPPPASPQGGLTWSLNLSAIGTLRSPTPSRPGQSLNLPHGSASWANSRENSRTEGNPCSVRSQESLSPLLLSL